MKKIIKYILFVFIFLVILSVVSSILNPAHGYDEWYVSNTVSDFYRQRKNSIDAIFLGNSCIYSSVSPLEIFNENGIVTFDLSTPGQKVWSSYYLLKEAFKTQSPKVCFIECGEFMANKEQGKLLDKRNVIDSIKLSKNKLDVINDDIYNLSFIEKLGAIVPAIEYHSRWQDINERDIRKNISKEEMTYKGFVIDTQTKAYTGEDKFSDNISANENFENKKSSKITENDEELANGISSNARKYLNKMRELCKENNCELVIIKIPEPQYWNDGLHDRVESYSKIHQLRFLDLNYAEEDLKIDWNTDTTDSGYHLNIKGAKKVSDYLAKFLKDNYNLENHKEDSNFSNWNTFYESYCNAISCN